MINLHALGSITLAAALCGGAIAEAPIGTTMTYQGQLQQGGQLVDGFADFVFTLHDQSVGGMQIGPTLSAPTVAVEQGVFTVLLDFGPGAFDGNERWLQIAARTPAGSGLFIPLNPRQPVTTAPYALYALDAPPTPWSLIPEIPEGFLDGIDNDTQYSFSGGLQLDRGTNQVGISFGSGVTLTPEGGLTLSSDGFSNGQFMAWNGSSWGPASYVGGAGIAITGLTVSVAPSGVATSMIANGAVTTDKIADGTIATVDLANNAVTTAKMADGAVTGGKIADGTILAADLASNAVTTVKISSSAVTVDKVANGAINSAKLASDAASLAKVSNGVCSIAGNVLNMFNGGCEIFGPTPYVDWRFNNGVGNPNGDYSIRAISDAESQLRFQNANNPALLVLRPGGRVGIGTASPSQTLHVVGNALKTEGGSSWLTPSDARIKRNIQPLEGALDIMLALRGVTFEYIESEELPTGEQMGVIAQEVMQVVPEWVSVADDGMLAVGYTGFEALTIESFKSVVEENRRLEAMVDTLRDDVRRLEARLEALAALLAEGNR